MSIQKEFKKLVNGLNLCRCLQFYQNSAFFNFVRIIVQDLSYLPVESLKPISGKNGFHS